MRTTINIDDQLLLSAKHRAVSGNRCIGLAGAAAIIVETPIQSGIDELPVLISGNYMESEHEAFVTLLGGIQSLTIRDNVNNITGGSGNVSFVNVS